jgi:hypothetical protein
LTFRSLDLQHLAFEFIYPGVMALALRTTAQALARTTAQAIVPQVLAATKLSAIHALAHYSYDLS